MAEQTNSITLNDTTTKTQSLINATEDEVKLEAPTLSSSYYLVLPSDDGVSGDLLKRIDTNDLEWSGTMGAMPGGQTAFQDISFNIYKSTDAFAKMAFKATAIAPATTRTIAMPNADVDLNYIPPQSLETSGQPQFAKIGVGAAAGSEQLKVTGTAKATTVTVGGLTPAWATMAAMNQSVTTAASPTFADMTQTTLKLKDVSLTAPAATYTLTLPPDAGTNTHVLRTNGSGTLTWVAPTGGAGGGSFDEATFDIYNAADTTAKAKFAINVATSTTRTITMPDANVDLGNLPAQLLSTTSSPQFAKIGLGQAAGTETLEITGTAKATTSVIVGASTLTSTGAAYIAALDQSVASAASTQFAKLASGAGTVSAPSLYFASDTSSGLYRVGADEVGISVSGTKKMGWGTGGFNVSTLLGPDGTVTAPSVAFTSDSNNGFYRVGADDWALTVAGAKTMEIAATSYINGATFASNDTTVSTYVAGNTELDHMFFNWYVAPSTLSSYCSSSSKSAWSDDLNMFVYVLFGSTYVHYSYDGCYWSEATSGTASDWIDICYGNGKFVAVAGSTSQNAKYSSDGISFTTVTINSNIWYGICYGNGYYVAVGGGAGSGNRVATSTDAITWTTRASAADNTWFSVVYSPELNLYVAVSYSGSGNRVMTSSNLSTWTTQSSAANNQWRSVAWSAYLGVFAAVSDDGSGNRVMTSSNGNSWITRATTSNVVWRQIIWNDDVKCFVAAGTGSASYNSQAAIMYSTDGATWYERWVGPVDYQNASAISYSPTLKRHVLSALGSTYGTSHLFNDCSTPTLSRQLTSSFFNWNMTTPGFVTSGGSSTQICVFKDGRFVAAAYAANKMYYSIDGSTWTSTSVPVANQWLSVCYSPKLDLLIAVSNTGSGNQVITSSDSTSWTSRTTPTAANWYSVCWSPELSLFVAVAHSTSSNCMYSSNGTTWVSVTISAHSYSSVCWSSKLGLFCAASNGNNLVATSTNGSSWTTTAVSLGSGAYPDICWAPELGKFCIVNQSGYMATSSDVVTWVSKKVYNGEFFSIIWIPDFRCFVIGAESRIFISYDGQTLNQVYKYSYNSATPIYASLAYSRQLRCLTTVSDTSGTNGGASLFLPKTNTFMAP